MKGRYGVAPRGFKIAVPDILGRSLISASPGNKLLNNPRTKASHVFQVSGASRCGIIGVRLGRTGYAMNKGSCLCGDITWEIDGDLIMMSNCHCSMCRKFHGVGYGTYVGVMADDFRWLSGEGNVQTYESSPGGLRPFCPRCGSIVASTSRDGSMAFMPAGNMEGELDRELDSHIFVGSKAPWYEIHDNAPQHDAYPPDHDVPPQENAQRLPETPGSIGGSCLCGAVAYEVSELSDRFGYCHCSRCRKARSAGASAQVFAAVDDFRWTSGESHIRHFDLPEGEVYRTDFCEICGSPTPTIHETLGFVLIPAGSLDQDPGVRPQAHIYVGSKAPWVEIKDGLLQFLEMPEG